MQSEAVKEAFGYLRQYLMNNCTKKAVQALSVIEAAQSPAVEVVTVEEHNNILSQAHCAWGTSEKYIGWDEYTAISDYIALKHPHGIIVKDKA